MKKIGYEALKFVLKNCQFQSVLDIGGGEGAHSKIYIDYGKSVTGIDVGKSPYFARNRQKEIILLVTSIKWAWKIDTI